MRIKEVFLLVANTFKVLFSKKAISTASLENSTREIVVPALTRAPVVNAEIISVPTPTNDVLPQFVNGEPNLAGGENTKRVRQNIMYEFGLNFDMDCLQCVEYAQYRVKQKLGIWIDWPVKAGRDAKHWPSILGPKYKVSDTPVVNSVASFDALSLGVHGHVVFVENVFPNGDIEISEVNLPRDGIYNIKKLPPAIWRDKYGGKFISFS